MAPHVLIIDADPDAAQVTSAWVQRLAPAATVESAPTPDHAWRRVLRTPPDVLIVDPCPNKLDDLLFVQVCRARWPAVRVVVLASCPTPSLRSEVKRLGVDMYGEKPAALSLLRESFQKVLTLPAAP